MTNEEQVNQQIIKELDGMMLDLYSEIKFEPEIERNGTRFVCLVHKSLH